MLGEWRKNPKEITHKSIFRISKDDLTLFFDKKHIKMPDNEGESRDSLEILAKCGYSDMLCKRLRTEPETGIIGDSADLARRREIFGKHSIQLPVIQTFYKLLARQYEDSNIIFLIWAATCYLAFSLFSTRPAAYVEPLVVYSGILFVTVISAYCDWKKEK